jgi:hypothetical protein
MKDIKTKKSRLERLELLFEKMKQHKQRSSDHLLRMCYVNSAIFAEHEKDIYKILDSIKEREKKS